MTPCGIQCVCTPSLHTPHPQPKVRRQSAILIHISDVRGQSECVFPVMKKGTFMWVETGGMWNQEDRNIKISRRLTISVFRDSAESVCVWGHCILGRREPERHVGRREILSVIFHPACTTYNIRTLCFWGFHTKLALCAQKLSRKWGQTWGRGWRLT